MKYYAVIDTNVLVSALITKKKASQQKEFGITFLTERLFPCLIPISLLSIPLFYIESISTSAQTQSTLCLRRLRYVESLAMPLLFLSTSLIQTIQYSMPFRYLEMMLT